MTELRDWVAGRTPSRPEALPLPLADGDGLVLDRLVDHALGELDVALAGTGERRGAFDLLAADALVTYACERAAEEDDPEEALLRVLRRVARQDG